MSKLVTISVLLLVTAMILISGCSSETGPTGKFVRGEGDQGEGEPCITSDDCDEIGEICISGVCIYEENV